MKIDILNNATKLFHRTSLRLQKHSPEIMVVAGVVGFVASAVMACKATTKVNDILEKTKADVDSVHRVLADEKVPADVYSEEDSKKDLAIIYGKTGLELVKLYAPSVVLGVASIASILGGHNILRKRNVALAAAYTTLSDSFKGYRSRIAERLGEDFEREVRFNIKAKEVDEVVVHEDGTQEVVKKTVQVADSNVPSDYARFFDCGNTGWTDDAEYNLMFLRNTQNYMNDLLQSRGYLFLNDVYDALGIPRSRAGQVVGWIYDEKNPIGDNCVDFCLYSRDDARVRDFVNGFEKTVLLDFNVDGNILDLI